MLDDFARVKQPLAAMITRTDTDLKSHRIWAKVERSAWPLRVMGDQIQVQQVLLNLITNAIKAMATVDGPRVLAVSSSRRDDGTIGAHRVAYNLIERTKCEAWPRSCVTVADLLALS